MEWRADVKWRWYMIGRYGRQEGETEAAAGLFIPVPAPNFPREAATLDLWPPFPVMPGLFNALIVPLSRLFLHFILSICWAYCSYQHVPSYSSCSSSSLNRFLVLLGFPPKQKHWQSCFFTVTFVFPSPFQLAALDPPFSMNAFLGWQFVEVHSLIAWMFDIGRNRTNRFCLPFPPILAALSLFSFFFFF